MPMAVRFDAAERRRRFHDHAEAGQALAENLGDLRHEAPVVLAIAGGGVLVAVEVARALGADLDVLLVEPVRRGADTLGLLAEGGAAVLDPVDDQDAVPADEIGVALNAARRELGRRARRYRAGRPLPDVSGRTVILVDTGIASGRTVRAALTARPHLRPKRLIVAVPAAAAMTLRSLRREVDEIVCVAPSGELAAVADAYDDFHPLAETEILGALARGRAEVMSQAAIVVSDVEIDRAGGSIGGTLTMPRLAQGVVVVV